jgi:hypothetical protein
MSMVISALCTASTHALMLIALPLQGSCNPAHAMLRPQQPPAVCACLLLLLPGALTHLGLSCTVEGDARAWPGCECTPPHTHTCCSRHCHCHCQHWLTCVAVWWHLCYCLQRLCRSWCAQVSCFMQLDETSNRQLWCKHIDVWRTHQPELASSYNYGHVRPHDLMLQCADMTFMWLCMHALVCRRLHHQDHWLNWRACAADRWAVSQDSMQQQVCCARTSAAAACTLGGGGCAYQ